MQSPLVSVEKYQGGSIYHVVYTPQSLLLLSTTQVWRGLFTLHSYRIIVGIITVEHLSSSFQNTM